MSKFEHSFSIDSVINELITIAQAKYNVESFDELPEQSKEYIHRYVNNLQEKDVSTKYKWNDQIFVGNFRQIIDNVLKQHPDCNIAMNGAIFDSSSSVFAQYLQYLGNRRNIEKGKMLKYKEEGNTALASFYKYAQLNTKEGGNSVYGLLNLDSYPLYSIDCAGAVTGTCSSQLQDLIVGHETVIGGRVILRDIDEVITYISGNVYQGEMTLEEIESHIIDDIELINVEDFFTKIMSYLDFEITEKQKLIVKNLIDSVFQSKINQIRFTLLNNLKYFFSSGKMFEKYLDSDMSNLTDMKNYDEHQSVQKLEVFLKLVKELVFPNFIPRDTDDLCRNYKRTTCLMSD